jgi:hypothetical protein
LENTQQHGATTPSTQTLHFVANFNKKRELYAFFCENQPLLTFWSHGLPGRCPLCRTENPLNETAWLLQGNNDRDREP